MSVLGAPTGTVPVPSGPFVHRQDLKADARGRQAHVAWTSVEAGNLALHMLPAGAESRSDVAPAREAVEDAMGVEHGSTLYLDQVHSTVVVTATGEGWGEGQTPRADAAVSPDGSQAMAVMVADCLPVVFVDALTGATAVAHAGREGLLGGVLEDTVDALMALRREGQQGAFGLKAWIGPGICSACYEVPQQMQDDAAARIPQTRATTSWGTPSIDLAGGAQAVLRARGVATEKIDLCTYEDHRVFSHRRAPGKGRFAGLVWTDAVA